MLLALVVGGLGFEFRVFVAGWRHALRSEWPFIIIIIIIIMGFLRTPSRATLGPWGAPTSRGWTLPCMTWAA